MYKGEYDDMNKKLIPVGESLKPEDILGKKVEIAQK